MRIWTIVLIITAIAIAACQPQQPTPLPQQNITADCSSDSDCAVGGCSGQVCTATEKAKGLLTTCEYREEYGCLKLTSCGCNQGSCGWKETPELNECIKKAGTGAES